MTKAGRLKTGVFFFFFKFVIFIWSFLHLTRRFLPEEQWHLLESETTFQFEGREVRTDSICEVCGKIFEQPTMKKRHLTQVRLSSS